MEQKDLIKKKKYLISKEGKPVIMTYLGLSKGKNVFIVDKTLYFVPLKFIIKEKED